MVAAVVASVSHTALDGGSVEIRGDAFDLTVPFTSVAVASFSGRKHEFTSGSSQFGNDLAAEFGVRLDEEYSFQGGRLLLGSAVQTDPGSQAEHVLLLAVWQGSAYCLETAIYEGDLGYLVALFDSFTIEERSGGILLQAKDITATPFETEGVYRPSVVKLLRGLALLQIQQRTDRVEETLPPWRGRRTAGGELFTDGDSTVPLLILVGETTITTIYPNEGVSEVALSGALASLVTEWNPIA